MKFAFGAAAVAALSTGALATTTVFSNQAAFEAQLDGPALNEDFSGLSAGPDPGPIVFSGNGFTATASAIASPTDGAGGSGDLFNEPGLLSLNSATDALFIEFSPNTTAVGGVFLASDIAFAPIPGFDLIFTLGDGTTETITTQTGNEFIGFINLAGISNVTIDAPDDAALGTPNWPAADLLIVGAGIPAPGAAALLGAAGLAATRRRR